MTDAKTLAEIDAELLELIAEQLDAGWIDQQDADRMVASLKRKAAK